jgi:hypothetical protein
MQQNLHWRKKEDKQEEESLCQTPAQIGTRIF